MAIDEPTIQATAEAMRCKLSKIVPDFEIQYKAELVYEINRLKKERNAVILGHNYMEPALFHTIPDLTGDSLQLSREAAKTAKDVIVFCGVRFMAETAKILNPEKLVLLPAKKAGCSLAESITAKDVKKLREQFPGTPIVAYVNTYADVKAEVDYCCTSGNAAKLVKAINADTIIFLPDEYLGRNVAQETGKTVICASPKASGPENGPGLVIWKGRCEVHERFTVEDIEAIRRQFPDVCILAHPECSPEVVAASNFSASTTAMADYVKKSAAPQFLLLTECSMADNIIAENPDKEVLRLCSIRCPHMAEITLEDTLNALRNNQYEIEVPEPILSKAKRSLERMIAIG